MKNDLEKAVSLLQNGYTLAAVNGEKQITSNERGVKPLIGLLDSNTKLCGFCAADKVVGKGAAHLYAALCPDALYAAVISRPAYELLQSFRIPTEYGEITDNIINRAKTGICPVEQAVLAIDDNEKAIQAIRKKLVQLSDSSKG